MPAKISLFIFGIFLLCFNLYCKGSFVLSLKWTWGGPKRFLSILFEYESSYICSKWFFMHFAKYIKPVYLFGPDWMCSIKTGACFIDIELFLQKSIELILWLILVNETDLDVLPICIPPTPEFISHLQWWRVGDRIVIWYLVWGLLGVALVVDEPLGETDCTTVS